MKKAASLFLFIFCLPPWQSIAQSALTRYSFKQELSFKSAYQEAEKKFKKLNYRTHCLINNGQHIQLIRFENEKPLFYTTHNAGAAEFIGLDYSYEPSDLHSDLSGESVCIGIWDGGHVLDTHQEFVESNISRVTIENETLGYINHSTHVGGTIAAFGVNPMAKGMAYRSELYSRNYLNDLAEMATEANKHTSFISNHSYGPLAGWLFNNEEDQWYWYGDMGIDTSEDYKFGFYGSLSEQLDELACLAPYYLMVFSAGNDRNDGPESQPITHKVWTDKWVNSYDIRENDGGTDGYGCIGMNGVAKNVLTVGAIDDSNDGAMSDFSTWGPTDDGRIKPDIAAPGVGIYSSAADADNSYAYYSGTSMAAACVSGGLGVLQQLQENFCPDVPLLSSTLKGILIHTASESGHTGPDYQFGWGIVNFNAAHQFLEENISSGGALISEQTIDQGTVYERSIRLDDDGALKATIVWTDVQGKAEAATLNPETIKLVNDLDMSIEHVATGTIYYPWVLDPENPQNKATTGINIRDNVEQVTIEDALSGDYILRVDASKIVSETQTVSLLISGHTCETGILPPKNLDGFYSSEGLELTWESPDTGLPDFYQVYRNGSLISSCSEKHYTDANTAYKNSYTYQISASYSQSETNHSLLTNTLDIISLPVIDFNIEENFEALPDYWTFANDEYGWRWGDASALNSYYLDYEGNSSMFMGINSDALGNGEHVSDCLVSIPLKVPTSKELTVEFDYFFNNETYDTDDIFELVYRNSINQEWIPLHSIPSIDGWNNYQIQIQLSADDEVIQIGFLYDDQEEWGFGAGIDDLKITDLDMNTVIENQFSESHIIYYIDKNRDLHLQLTHSGNDYFTNIEIYEITGQKILNHMKDINGESDIVVPLDYLPTGSYILNAQSHQSALSKVFILY